MQVVPRPVLPALLEVEFASLKGLRVAWIGQIRIQRRIFHALPLIQELPPSQTNRLCQLLAGMIGEVKERRGRGELLTLKQHRSCGSQQQYRRQRLQLSRACQVV